MRAASPRSNGARTARIALQAGVAGALGAVPLAVFPWGYNPFGPVKLFVLCCSAALVALGIALDPDAAARVRRALARPPGIALAALAALFLLASLLADDPLAAFLGAYPGYESGLVALGAMLLAGFGGMAALEDGHAFVARILTLALLGVGLGTLAEIGRSLAADMSAERALSTLGNASNLGLWCAIVLPLVASGLLAEESRPWRIAAAVALPLGFVALVASGSRGALLAAAASVVVGAVVLGTAFERKRGVFLIVAFALLTALAVTGVFVAGSRTTAGTPDTATGRMDTWKASLPLVTERPFLGYGPGGFGRAFAARGALPLADEYGRDRPLEDPHNVVLSTAVSAGPLAAVVLITLAVLLAAASWRGRGDVRAAACAAASAAGLVGLQFHFLTLDTGAVLFACAGYLAAYGEGAGATRAVASVASRAALARGLAWAAVVLFVTASVLACGVLAADAALATGFAQAGTDWPAAARAFARAERLAPWDSAPPWALGRAARDAASAGDTTAEATGLAALKRAERLRPRDHRILRDRADLLAVAVLAGPTDRPATIAALANYDGALALAPSDPLVFLGRGGVLLATGEYPAAAKDLARATELSPRLTVGWRNLALAYDAVGDPGGAEWARARAEQTERSAGE